MPDVQAIKKLVAEYREIGEDDMAYMAMLDIIQALEAALPDPERLGQVSQELFTQEGSVADELGGEVASWANEIKDLNLGSSEEFVVFADGLGYATCCTSLDEWDVCARMNAVHPSGTSSKWKISKDKTFRDGVNSNPCPCDDHPLTHRHFLMEW